MEKEKIKIGRYVFEYQSEYDYTGNDGEKINEKTFTKTVKGLEMLHSIYKTGRKQAIRTNFGGDEFEQNSYIVITDKTDENNVNTIVFINPPTYKGDRNWWSYSTNNNNKFTIEAKIITTLKK